MNYYYQIEGDKRNNIGDVLQGMVAKAFLPENALAADRESLALLDKEEPAFLIANGWYMHSFENFPPPENVHPLYVSIHVANSQLLAEKKVRDHFKAHAPIGCRDIKTLNIFLGWGIPAYYSSCLTTTTKARAAVNTSAEGEILLVDNVDHPVPAEVKEKLEALLGKPLVSISHDPPNPEGDFLNYTIKAEAHMNELLERYCKASMIVTTKIHCALPCLGMGVKVIMVHPVPDEGRLAPLAEFIHILSYDEVLGANTIQVPEVKTETFNKRRDFLTKLCRESTALGYSALREPTDPSFKRLKRKSELMAKIYRAGVVTAYRLGIARKKLKRVYGSGL
ncbi:polysaccharide pyruvyl transferase family protein [Pedobacter metabolipauper]|uniref:Polysaccharide pyruvyl transferase n=1 Tax=Pedobacter metabolipauper TaxID=425513 RepID=A0A4R6SX28_9SPHI|nr:polysaccharide pyruvyl transferase family protein [Pedobacter metabolipauper]TDQ09989.1 polysaccharide pyruvyl transferase [Pedobacter metabolipauper]